MSCQMWIKVWKHPPVVVSQPTWLLGAYCPSWWVHARVAETMLRWENITPFGFPSRVSPKAASLRKNCDTAADLEKKMAVAVHWSCQCQWLCLSEPIWSNGKKHNRPGETDGSSWPPWFQASPPPPQVLASHPAQWQSLSDRRGPNSGCFANSTAFFTFYKPLGFCHDKVTSSKATMILISHSEMTKPRASGPRES